MPQFSIDAARGQQIYEFKELTRISTRSWLAQQVVFTKTGLGVGTHTITVEVAPQPLTFAGTEVSWIAAKRPYRGMAKVYKNVAAVTLTLCGFSYVVYFAALRREAR